MSFPSLTPPLSFLLQIMQFKKYTHKHLYLSNKHNDFLYQDGEP